MNTVDVRLLNKTKGTEVASRLGFALKNKERRKGLTGRQGIQDCEAFVFPKCRQIHTFGMLFTIDVIFINRQGVVVKIYRCLEPGRLTGVVFTGFTTVELAAGTLERTGTEPGDRLEFEGWNPGFSRE